MREVIESTAVNPDDKKFNLAYQKASKGDLREAPRTFDLAAELVFLIQLENVISLFNGY